MVEYCEGSGCRRKIILESFGEQVMKYTELGIMEELGSSLFRKWRYQPGITWCDSYGLK